MITFFVPHVEAKMTYERSDEMKLFKYLKAVNFYLYRESKSHLNKYLILIEVDGDHGGKI